MALIQFTRNYRDLSTDAGFQFKFYCDRCVNGYQTEFQVSALGTVTHALDVANNLFGGMLGKAASAAWLLRRLRQRRYRAPSPNPPNERCAPHFHKCKRSGHWVDDDCWNTECSLCKDCAPDLQEEMSSFHVQGAVTDAREKANQVDYVSTEQFKETIIATCPHCGAKSSGGKFCQECGKPLAAEKSCKNCGAKIEMSAKFCDECGTKQ